MASVFSSHPDESNIVEKIIATNVERSVVFMGLTKIEQIENLRDGRDSPRGANTAGWEAARVAVLERERKNQSAGKIMSQRSKPPNHLKQKL